MFKNLNNNSNNEIKDHKKISLNTKIELYKMFKNDIETKII
jgi:hypothetical protein